jgi:hypothetical protein
MVLFLATPVAGLTAFFITFEWLILLLGAVVMFAVAAWGQYWRDVAADAWSLLLRAREVISEKMKTQGLDPADPDAPTLFDTSELNELEMVYWQITQQFIAEHNRHVDALTSE